MSDEKCVWLCFGKEGTGTEQFLNFWDEAEEQQIQVDVFHFLITGNFEDFKCYWYKTLQYFAAS